MYTILQPETICAIWNIKRLCAACDNLTPKWSIWWLFVVEKWKGPSHFTLNVSSASAMHRVMAKYPLCPLPGSASYKHEHLLLSALYRRVPYTAGHACRAMVNGRRSHYTSRNRKASGCSIFSHNTHLCSCMGLKREVRSNSNDWNRTEQHRSIIVTSLILFDFFAS